MCTHIVVCICLRGEPSRVSHTVVYGSDYDFVNVGFVNKRRLSVHLLNCMDYARLGVDAGPACEVFNYCIPG